MPDAGFALVGLLLSSVSLAALEPRHSITQYAHAAWTRQADFPGTASALSQTQDGSLWIGTESGLFRFDGLTFLRWKPPAGKRLPSEFVNALAPARDGGLWIGTRGGLSHWKGNSLDTYQTSQGPEGSSVIAILLDHAGTVWAGTAAFRSGGLCRAEANQQLRCYGPGTGLPDREVSSLFEDRSRNLWIGSEGGLYKWGSGKAQSYASKESALAITSIAEGADGGIIAATSIEGDIERLAGGNLTNYLVRPAGKRTQVRALHLDHDGGLWIATNGQGLAHFYRGRVDRYTRADGLSGDVVLNFFEDREGSLWVATDRGLDRFRDLPVATLSKREGLSDDTVGSVFTSNEGGIWIGTGGGLNRLQNDRLQNDRITLFDQSKGLPSDATQSLFEDQAGVLWADSGAGLAYLQEGRFQHLDLPRGQKMRSIATEAEDHEGSLWLSDLEHGMIRVHDRKVEEVVPWSRFEDRQASALEADPRGRGLWLGFVQGGVAYYASGRVARWYAPPDALAHATVTDLHFDRKGALWIASEGGLGRLSDGVFRTLTTAGGLPCDQIHAMVEDDDGALWLNAACGLIRITRSDLSAWVADPGTKIRTKTFGAGDGMRTRPKLTGYFRRAAKSKDGRLWFPVLDGVAVVDPRHLPENRMPPPVSIEQIVADHKSYTIYPQLKLPSLTTDLQIDYTAFSFVAPDQVRFRYKLEGYDREWNDVNGRRQAPYTNLPPRRYRFRVIAANNDGVWNEAGAVLEFSIQPAFYQTNWFRLLSLAAFALVLWTLYRLRLRQVAAQLDARFEARLAERTRIARELHDTLLQNISGFALQLGGLSKTVTAPELAKDRLRVLRQQAEEWLREARESVWDLRSPVTEGQELSEAMRRSAEQITIGKAVQFHMTVSGRRSVAPVRMQEHLLRIFQEAARNAVHHGRANEIAVHIAYVNPEVIRIQIQDDGCGFDLEEASRKMGHWGLATMRERAQKIGAELKISTAPGQGVEIEIVAPIMSHS